MILQALLQEKHGHEHRILQLLSQSLQQVLTISVMNLLELKHQVVQV